MNFYSFVVTPVSVLIAAQCTANVFCKGHFPVSQSIAQGYMTHLKKSNLIPGAAAGVTGGGAGGSRGRGAAPTEVTGATGWMCSISWFPHCSLHTVTTHRASKLWRSSRQHCVLLFLFLLSVERTAQVIPGVARTPGAGDPGSIFTLDAVLFWFFSFSPRSTSHTDLSKSSL